MKNWFKNQFLLELSQKVKEIGSYLEIMSFRSIRTHFKQIFYYRWCNAATPLFYFCKKCISTVFQGIWLFSRHIWILETLESLIFAFNFTALCLRTKTALDCMLETCGMYLGSFPLISSPDVILLEIPSSYQSYNERSEEFSELLQNKEAWHFNIV